MTAAEQARYRQRQSERDPDGWRRRNREAQDAFRRRYPEKKSAWNAVYQAVKSGRLVRPTNCEQCLAECTPEASHDDYFKPLDVEWLCKTCHSTKDAQLRRRK